MKMMIKKIYKQSIIALVILSAIAAFVEWKRLPISILTGGLIGLVNLKGIAWGIKGLSGEDKQITGRFLVFSFLRMIGIALFLVVLFMYEIVSVIGVALGFTLVMAILVKEGLKSARKCGLRRIYA